MTVTISRLYDNYADAQKAVQGLEAAGVPHSDISIVANNSDNWYTGSKKVDRDHDGVDDRAEGAGKGAGIGAGVGGAAGLLAGLGLLAIPGLGPVVAANVECCRCQPQQGTAVSMRASVVAFALVDVVPSSRRA
jgi:hypothetical protein